MNIERRLIIRARNAEKKRLWDEGAPERKRLAEERERHREWVESIMPKHVNCRCMIRMA